MFKSLLKQFPKGLGWLLPKVQTRRFIEALSVEPERIAEFLRGIVREANPGTAVDTQEEWFEQYNITYDPAGPTESKQQTTLERYISLGGQDLPYIQDKIDRAGFDTITMWETPRQWTEVSCVGAGSQFFYYNLDLARFLGQTIEFGIWIKNVDLTSQLRCRLRLPDLAGPFTELFVEVIGELGTGLSTAMTLYKFTAVVPASLPVTTAVFIFDIIDAVDSEYMIVSNGYFGDEYIPNPNESKNWTRLVCTFGYTDFTFPDTITFIVEGALTTPDAQLRLAGLIERLSPGHCIADYQISFTANVYGVAICGVGICSAS